MKSSWLLKPLTGVSSGGVRGEWTHVGGFMHSDILLRCEDSAEARRRGFSATPADLPVATGARPLFIYSRFHHRVHVSYYLWSHSETAHWISPTSYQQFVPGRFVCGGKKETVILEEAGLWMRTTSREEIRPRRDLFEAQGSAY